MSDALATTSQQVIDYGLDIKELTQILENNVTRPNIKMLISTYVEKLEAEKDKAQKLLDQE